jgi:hypothetical protein
LLYQKMRNSVLFKSDIDEFGRAKAVAVMSGRTKDEHYGGEGLERYTYEFLMNALERNKFEEQEKKTENQMSGIISRVNRGGLKQEEFGLAALGGGGGGGKGKGGKKNKSRGPKSKGPPGIEEASEFATPGFQPKGAGKQAGKQANQPPTANQQPTWCWFYNSSLRGGKECKYGDKCRRDHDDIGEAIFRASAPPARSNSPAPSEGGQQARPAAPKNAEFYLRYGKKVPKHCVDYRKTGTCSHKADNGGKCLFPLMTEEQFRAKSKALNQSKKG